MDHFDYEEFRYRWRKNFNCKICGKFAAENWAKERKFCFECWIDFEREWVEYCIDNKMWIRYEDFLQTKITAEEQDENGQR
ncbi:hypothetical protein D3C87_75820 [compost metagenome]